VDIDLRLDWCSYDAAKYAVMRWHYSRSMPSSKLIKIGVWENKKFIGCILFGIGANMNLARPYGLKKNEACELVRIALGQHATPVSRLIKIALSMVKKLCPGLALVVSYADRDQGHEGKIYQASNFIKDGECFDEHYFFLGKKVHPRTVGSKYGTRSIKTLKKAVDPNLKKIKTAGKIKYIYWLKKCAPSARVEQPTHQSEDGGASPTGALHLEKESNGTKAL